MTEKPTRRLTMISAPNEPAALKYEPVRVENTAPVQGRVERDDEIDLLQLFGTLWRGKWIILLCSLLAIVAGGYYAYAIAVPKYSASTQLALEARDQQVVDLESVISGVSTDQSAINTELEVIRSRVLLERLIADMDLVDDPEFNASLRESSAISVSALYAFAADFAKNTFSVQLPELPKDPPPTDEEIAVKVLGNVRAALAVSSQRQTFLININATTEDPRKSADMADHLTQLYLDDQIAIKFSATEYAVNWLSERVSELELDLKDKEDAVKDLRAESELVSLEALEALNIRAKDVRERLSETQAAAESTQDSLERLTALGENREIPAILAEIDDPTLQRVAEGAQAGNLTAQRTFFERFDTLLERARLHAEREASQRDVLQASYERIQAQIAEQDADLVKLNQLVREADATRVLYETFLTRLKETSVQIGLQQADSRILSAALPGKLVAPRRSVILALSMVLGGMLGIGLVLLRQFLHDGFRTAEELEQVTGYTVLGQIPRIPIRKRKGLVDYLHEKPTSAAAEAIRNLRTSVLLSHIDQPPKVIMSTSSIPGEGKTTIAIALTQNLSGLGKKVLLMEGDIRRRSFTQYFKQTLPGDVVSVVSGEHTISEAVIRDEQLGADILMGAKSSLNAADLFSSEKFHDFLRNVREAYDYVIIDMPPVLVVPDARVVGQSVDAIIYSVLWDRTAKGQVLDGLRQFSSINLNVAGLVLSQIDPARMKRYGYGRKYGAYSGYGKGYYDA